MRTTQNNSDARPDLGAAHLNPRDAYRDVPILKQPTWNHEVAAYFFLGGVSAGSALIGSIAEMVGSESRKELARTAHYVSLATLIPCPFLLIADLGKPARFHHMLRIFKPSSPMNLGSWALTAHGAGATVTVLCMLARKGKLPLIGWALRVLPERLLAGLGIPSSFVLAGYTGVLLGTTSVPVWHDSPLLGALFMSSSLSTGAAFLSFASSLTDRGHESDRHALSLLGCLFSVVEFCVLMGYVATLKHSATALIKGRLGTLLAGAAGAICVGALIEMATLLLGGSGRKRDALALTSSALTLVGGGLLRWAVVRAGRVSAADREGTLNAMGPSERSPGWRAQNQTQA